MKSPRNKLPNRLILLRVGLSISTLVALLGPGAARSQAAQPAVAPGRDIILDLRTPAYQINADDVTVAGYGTIDTPGAPASVIKAPGAAISNISTSGASTSAVSIRCPPI